MTTNKITTGVCLVVVGLTVAIGVFNGCSNDNSTKLNSPDPGAAALISTGLLVRDPADTNVDAQVLELSTGRQINLPRSARAMSQGSSDTWGVSRPTQELIRENGAETVDIIRWPALTVAATFTLASETNPNEKAKLLRPRMSHDGRYIAAYEFTTNSSRKMRALVFDREGKIQLTGSYQESDGGGGFDWLPDGRLVYFEKGKVLIYEPSQGASQPINIQYPLETRAGSENVAISPDGKSLAIVKWTRLQTSRGDTKEQSVLYLVPLSGGMAKVSAIPTQQRIDDPVGLVMMDLSWSADGKLLGFAARVGNDPYGGGLGANGCPLVYAVSGNSDSPITIDGVRDPEKVVRFPTGNGGSELVYSCGMTSFF